VADNWTGNTLNVPAGALSGTSMRYHELALQRWLNKVFTLRWGVPVPVVFTSPMDAFSLFSKLWSEANNPFQYLLDVKDENGVPCYQPYPAPVRYPLISVYRKGWKYRNYQNFSIHRMRWINYPSVSDAAELHDAGTHQQGTDYTKCQIAEVTTSRFPMAFDYRFQIDHFCNRPDTQAFFTSQLFREFWRTGGPQLQSWMKVSYPGFGDKLVRVYIEGDIESMTPEEPEQDKNVEFRTSFTVVVEGYDIDLNYKIYPALWYLILREGSAPPEAVDAAFNWTGTVDLREQPESDIIDYKYETTVMPPPGTCAGTLRNIRLENEQVHDILLNSLIVTYPGPLAFPGYPPAAGVQAFGIGTITVLPPPAPAEASGTESGTLSWGFYVGTYTGTGTTPVIDAGTWSDAGTGSSTFIEGSMDLYIYIEQIRETGQFFNGTYYPVTIEDGTNYETGTLASLFTVGTYASAVVDGGTYFGSGSLVAAFDSGTYVDVVVDAGSYYESGSLSSAFVDGTYTAMIVSGGTYYEAGSQTAGFYIGTYA